MITWPNHLVKELQRKNVILVIGSGVSARARCSSSNRAPPTWVELLSAGIDQVGTSGTRHIRSCLRRNDFPLTCELLKRFMKENWTPFILYALRSPNFQVDEIHKLIFQLDQRLVFTTNVDEIFDNYVRQETSNNFTVKSYYDDDASVFLRNPDQYLIKLHGCVTKPSQMIFTQTDYASARSKFSNFYDAIAAGFLAHTVLFIGCGLQDPDIRILLENNKFGFPHLSPHYLILPRKLHEDEIATNLESKNLKILSYSAKDDHHELIDSLKFLVQQTQGESPP